MLVAEDNEVNALLIRALLSKLGHRPDGVRGGIAAVDAWAAAGERREPYDLVLMDLTLPGGIDGLEATRRIRGLKGCSGRTPIVGISGCGEAMTEKAARLAGMNGYLVKPVTPRMLAAAVAASVNGER